MICMQWIWLHAMNWLHAIDLIACNECLQTLHAIEYLNASKTFYHRSNLMINHRTIISKSSIVKICDLFFFHISQCIVSQIQQCIHDQIWCFLASVWICNVSIVELHHLSEIKMKWFDYLWDFIVHVRSKFDFRLSFNFSICWQINIDICRSFSQFLTNNSWILLFITSSSIRFLSRVTS